jgi:hypothetical protein
LKFPFPGVGGSRLLETGAACPVSAAGKESGMSDKHEKAGRIVEGAVDDLKDDNEVEAGKKIMQNQSLGFEGR